MKCCKMEMSRFYSCVGFVAVCTSRYCANFTLENLLKTSPKKYLMENAFILYVLHYVLLLYKDLPISNRCSKAVAVALVSVSKQSLNLH